jgi:hypothetical protein
MGIAPYGVLSDLATGLADDLDDQTATDRIPDTLFDEGVGVRAVRRSALHLKLGHEIAARVEAYKPTWGDIRPADAALVGFSGEATAEEIRRLCERRGVLVEGDQIDRKGFELLAKLLTEEKRIGRFLSHDCVRWNIALEHLARLMVSPITLEPEPVPAPEPQREPWDLPRRKDPRRDAHRVKVKSDAGSGFVERMKILGLDLHSVPDSMSYAGERWARMFELYCVLGINPLAARMNSDRMIMQRYTDMQTKAYDKVVTSKQ